LAVQAGYTPPLKHAPGILLHTTPQKPVLDRVVESADMNLKQNPDGRIVGNDGPYAPDTPEHQAIIQGPMDMPEEIRALHGERILATFRDKLPGLVDAGYDYLTLGYRPMPDDGMPIVGFAPGNSDVYVAVMHSGVTLAPIMGQYIAQELLSDTMIDELAPYRPDRF
jgi:glycine/D-amino acid oxidase-like deaminating enzyme